MATSLLSSAQVWTASSSGFIQKGLVEGPRRGSYHEVIFHHDSITEICRLVCCHWQQTMLSTPAAHPLRAGSRASKVKSGKSVTEPEMWTRNLRHSIVIIIFCGNNMRQIEFACIYVCKQTHFTFIHILRLPRRSWRVFFLKKVSAASIWMCAENHAHTHNKLFSNLIWKLPWFVQQKKKLVYHYGPPSTKPCNTQLNPVNTRPNHMFKPMTSNTKVI